MALGAVALGTALGLSIGRRALGVSRVVAAVIAVLAVALQLVPEAVGEVGWGALAVTALGLGLPVLVGLGAHRVFRAGGAEHLPLELAYGGLLLHQLGDGLALGALGSPVHDHGHEVSLLAIGLHAVALSAVFVLAFRDARGRAHALLRAVGMSAVLAVGALVAGLVPGALLAMAHPWVAALTAGLLLHVALHPFLHLLGIQPAHAPQ